MRIEHLGFGDEAVEFHSAWDTQRKVHSEVAAGERENTVLLLEHLPVYTAGKRTKQWERPTTRDPVVDIDRGGKITWHGPGQIVGYPHLLLPNPIDVIDYVRMLEDTLMATCAEFGVRTQRVDGRSGVWCAATSTQPERKIAAIGVRVAKRVTMHGFALNCNNSLDAYDKIIPCGITDAGVTTLTAETGQNTPVAEVLPILERNIRAYFPPFVGTSGELAEQSLEATL